MAVVFILRKKGNKKKRFFFYIENGKTQGNAFIENSEQSMDKKSASIPRFLLLPVLRPVISGSVHVYLLKLGSLHSIDVARPS